MFTINQIKDANLKVQTGADFPAYVQYLIKLGVHSYETYVTDGHTNYIGNNNFQLKSEEKYPNIEISDKTDVEKLKKLLKDHQDGKTHYLSFCRHAAASGVEKWKVDTNTMTCSYFDKKGNTLLKESVPAIAKAV